MLYGLIAIIIVFVIIQISSFNKLINEEFGGVDKYLKSINKAQESVKVKAFKKNLMYQSILLIIIICIGLVLDRF